MNPRGNQKYLRATALIFLVFSTFLYPAIEYTENWETGKLWVWQAYITAPELIINDYCKIQSRLDQTSIVGKPEVPFYSKIIFARPENITITLDQSNLKTIKLPHKINIFQDQIINGKLNKNIYSPFSPTYPAIYPPSTLQKNFIGCKNGIPLTEIRILPYRIFEHGKLLQYHQKISVNVNINQTTAPSQPSFQKPVLTTISDSPIFQNLKSQNLAKKTSSNPPYNQSLVKITINRDGIYRIYRKDLLDSLKQLKNQIKTVDPRTFQIHNKGNKIPIFVYGEEDGEFNKGDYIEFVGLKNPNHLSDSYYHPFTNNNIYWISWGRVNGLRIATESARPSIEHEQAIIPHEYEYLKHIEANNRFVRLGRSAADYPAYEKDHWFFDSGISTGIAKSYSFKLAHPNEYTTNNFYIKANLHGLTYTGYGHNVSLYINNHFVTNGEWHGQKPHIIENNKTSNLPNSFLKNGENSIRIAVEGDYSEDRFDKILFNWLEIEYYRKYRAYQNFIEFSIPKNYPEGIYHFPIENFSNGDISVYKVGISKLTDFEINHNKSQNKYSIILEDHIHVSNTRYFAASKNGLLSPIKIQADTLAGLKKINQGGDIIVITPQKWGDQFRRLEKYYKQQGLTPKIIFLENINNEFNHGNVGPIGIKNFLTYAFNNWQPQFQYLLLVGDAKVRAEEAVLPAFFYQTYQFGACACDYWYSLTDPNSQLPQFAIGRWPCSTADELELLINKRLNYAESKKLKAPWHNKTMFIAGFEDAFKNQTEHMINRNLPKKLNINRIFINPTSQNTPYWDGSDSLINDINAGLSLINFFGHGGGAVWSDKGLFTNEHLPLLENRVRLPFITSMTCFTGDFANMNSLGENLLLLENGGAIGLLGSSSVGWIKNDYILSKEIYKNIFKPGITIGDAIQTGKIKYLTSNNYFSHLKKSMVFSYNLLGDPTVILPFTQNEIKLEIDTTRISPGEQVKLSGNLPFNHGEGYINLYNLEKYRIPINSSIYSIDNSQFQAEITLPGTTADEELYFNYYFRDNSFSKAAAGYTSFNIKGEDFYGFECFPKNPQRQEDIILKINLDHKDLSKIYCLVDTINVYSFLDEIGIEHINSFNNYSKVDTLPMVPTEIDNSYQLKTPIRSNRAGILIALKFVARSKDNSTTESTIYTVQVKPEPDLIISGIKQAIDNYPALSTSVYYSGTDTLRNVKLRITEADGTLYGVDKFKIFPDIENVLSIKGELGHGTKNFIAEIDPDNKITENNENNNKSDPISMIINTFPILAEHGSSYTGNQNDTIRYDGHFSIYLPPGIVDDSGAVRIHPKKSQPNLYSQPDYQIIKLDSIYCYSVQFSEPPHKDFYIEFTTDIDSIKKTAAISRYSRRLKIWLCFKNEHAGKLAAYFSQAGQFALMLSEDNTDPYIELNIDGKQIYDGSYISEQPSISIIGEDKNGVNMTNNGLQVFLDSNPVDFNKFNIPDTIANGNYVTAQFRPELTCGNHNLKVELVDAAGNKGVKIIEFIISDDLKLKDYGNFPNPFKTQTTFIYELTRRVDILQIKIYTVAGRHIKTIDNKSHFNSGEDLRNSGYHEVTWDGLDKYGNFLANGVYFYKIYIKKDDKTKSSIGKIAKSR